jgi:hypothetical protein
MMKFSKMRVKKKTTQRRMKTTKMRKMTMMKKMLMGSHWKVARALAKSGNQRQHLANFGIRQ